MKCIVELGLAFVFLLAVDVLVHFSSIQENGTSTLIGQPDGISIVPVMYVKLHIAPSSGVPYMLS